jgi:hypothetical protein
LICDIVRHEGLADHYAGALLWVKRTTLERWKAENEHFALALEEARAEFTLALLRTIRQARKRDGTPDWRAQAWAMKHAGDFPKPTTAAESRQEKEITGAPQKRAILAETPAIPAPAERSAPGSMRENAAILPENAVRPGSAPEKMAPLTGRIAPAGENASILPETRPTAQAVRQKAA